MEHPDRTFCFAELHTTDVERSTAFYGELFGWTAVPVQNNPEYFLFQLRGQDVIAMRRTSGPQRLLGYLKVASVDATAARVQELGGRIETPAFDTPGIARTAVAADREHARFGLWESRGHGGAAVQDAIGTMWWIELLSLDLRGARDFYPSLFGWNVTLTHKYADPGATGEGLTIFRVGETAAGSGFQADPDWGIGPRWTVFFAIDHWDETVRRLVTGGGEVVFWHDVPNAGRLGVVHDYAGAAFIVMKPLG
jgi:uncharacterized protein